MINLASLNYFDIFCLIIVGSSIILAFFKGFISTILSLIRFVLALFVTFNFSYLLVPLTSKYISHHAIAEYAAFIALFLIILIILSIIKYYIIKSLSFLDKGYIDRVFGGLFGLIRGVAIVCMIFFTIISFTGAVEIKENSSIASFKYIRDNAPGWINKAQLENQLLDYSKIMVAMLPQELWKKIIDVLVSKVEEKQITNFDPDNLNTKLLMIKKINQLLASNNNAKSALEILNNFQNFSKDQQKQMMENFLADYNNNVVKNISFEDHKKILDLIDKLQVESK